MKRPRQDIVVEEAVFVVAERVVSVVETWQ